MPIEIKSRTSRAAVVLAGSLAASCVGSAWAQASGTVMQAPMQPGMPSMSNPASSLTPAQVAAIVAAPDRTAKDREADARRKPAELLSFIGIKPGMTVLDISAGGGYTTELLWRAVGPGGHVYAQGRRPSSGMADRLKQPAAAGIVPVVQPFESPAPPEAIGKLDLATLVFNYHDFGSMGIDRAALNKAVFAALKPGGMYVVVDHSGRPGTGISESNTLHRIEESFLRKEVEAAGFKLAAEGRFLRNPDDPRDREEPVPPMPEDGFVLKFVKP